jgi:oligopeptide transport system substrate-binding protein
MFWTLFFPWLLLAQSPIEIQLPAEPNTLDPYHVSDVIGFNLCANLHSGLMKVDAKGNLVPGLAESYKISQDKKTYTFSLRPGIQYSDGKPIVPEDFVFGLRHALKKSTAARDASFFQAIKKSADPENKEFGVVAQKQKVVIQLQSPDSAFLSALSMPLAAPMKAEWLDQKGHWLPSSPTSGPFRVKKFTPDREIVLEGRDQKIVRFRVIREETTAINLFETKALDVLLTIPPEELVRLQKAHRVEVFPSTASFFLSFHTQKAPFQEKRWRKALSEAIDRNDLAKLAPGSTPSESYLPSALATERFPVPAKKEALLWAKNQEKIPLTLTYPNSGMANLLAQRLQIQWKKELGLEVKLDPMEWKAYLGKLSADAPALFFLGYSAPFPDPISHLKVFESNSPDNRAKFQSPKYDRLLQIVRTSTGKKRDEAVQQMHSILVQEEQIIVPLIEKGQIVAISPALQGFALNPFGVMDLEKLKKE